MNREEKHKWKAQWKYHFGKNKHLYRGTSGNKEGLTSEECWMPTVEVGNKFSKAWESYVGI